MTDKEIIQALRRCQFGAPCARCPAVSNKNCMDELHKCAADLIERLTAENVALREGESLGKVKRSQKQAYEKQIKSLRALTDRKLSEIKKLQKNLCWKDLEVDAAEWKQERAEAERDALREKQRWIPVTERLPKPEIDVLIVCNRNGYRFVTPAIYEDGKMLTQDSVWNWNEIYTYGLYSEEADDYYIPEGWWENRQFNPDDVYNNPVDCAVTHWMPLPEAPEEGEKEHA